MPPTPTSTGLLDIQIGTIFTLGHILGAFCTFCCVLGRSLPFQERWGTLRTRFGSAPGAFSRLRILSFFQFFAAARMRCQNIAHATKPQFLLCLPPYERGFTRSGPCTKKRHKIVPWPCRTHFPAQVMPKTRIRARQTPLWRDQDLSLVAFLAAVRPPEPLLGGTWAFFDRS